MNKKYMWMLGLLLAGQVMLSSMRRVAPRVGTAVISGVAPSATRSFATTNTNLMSMDQARQTLGVSAAATPQEIKQKFRAATLKAHPDQGGSDEQMKLLNEAHEILKGKAAASSDAGSYASPESTWQASPEAWADFKNFEEELKKKYEKEMKRMREEEIRLAKENMQMLASALCRAIQDGNVSVVQDLIKQGVDLKEVEKSYNTIPLLLLATQKGPNFEVLKLLLEAGLDPNVSSIVDYSGKPVSALVNAARKSNKKDVELLIAFGARASEDDLRGVLFPSSWDNKASKAFDQFGLLLTTNKDFTISDSDWDELLCRNDIYGGFKVIDALLSAGYAIPEAVLEKKNNDNDENADSTYPSYFSPNAISVLIGHGIQFDQEVLDRYIKSRDRILNDYNKMVARGSDYQYGLAHILNNLNFIISKLQNQQDENSANLKKQVAKTSYADQEPLIKETTQMFGRKVS